MLFFINSSKCLVNGKGWKFSLVNLFQYQYYCSAVSQLNRYFLLETFFMQPLKKTLLTKDETLLWKNISLLKKQKT